MNFYPDLQSEKDIPLTYQSSQKKALRISEWQKILQRVSFINPDELDNDNLIPIDGSFISRESDIEGLYRQINSDDENIQLKNCDQKYSFIAALRLSCALCQTSQAKCVFFL